MKQLSMAATARVIWLCTGYRELEMQGDYKETGKKLSP